MLALFREYEEPGEVSFITPKEFIPNLLLRQQIDDRQFDKFCNSLEVLAKELLVGEEKKTVGILFPGSTYQIFPIDWLFR